MNCASFLICAFTRAQRLAGGRRVGWPTFSPSAKVDARAYYRKANVRLDHYGFERRVDSHSPSFVHRLFDPWVRTAIASVLWGKLTKRQPRLMNFVERAACIFSAASHLRTWAINLRDSSSAAQLGLFCKPPCLGPFSRKWEAIQSGVAFHQL